MARVRIKAVSEPPRPAILIQIELDQKWLLYAAMSYNEDDIVLASDKLYDWSTAQLRKAKQDYPNVWKQSTVYPEVFQDPEEAWVFTSMHFPRNEEVRGWLEAQWCRVGDFRGEVSEEERARTAERIKHAMRWRPGGTRKTRTRTRSGRAEESAKNDTSLGGRHNQANYSVREKRPRVRKTK